MSNRIRMEKGIFIPAKAPYGYRLVNNELVIVPEEAEVVQRIYHDYLSGHGIFDIMNTLNQENIRHTNGSGKWNRYSINYILTNVTYTGDQIWQKTFATDVIPFRKVRNKGQRPKYFAESCGPAIIDKETYHLAQALMTEKKERYPRKAEVEALFRKRVYCAECGSLCKRKVCNGTMYWVCRRHDDGKDNCPSQQIPETVLEEIIRRCYGKDHLRALWCEARPNGEEPQDRSLGV